MKPSHFDFDAAYFSDLFDQVYDELYNHDEYEDYDYQKAIDAGDEILADEYYDDVIKDLVKRRGDYFSSDREIATIAICFDIMGLGGTHTKDIKKDANMPLPNWTDEEIEEIIRQYERHPDVLHIYYWSTDDCLEAFTHYSRDPYDNEYYSVDKALEEMNLDLTVENVRKAVEMIISGEEDYKREREREKERDADY